MKGGSVFLAPSAIAAATCGFGPMFGYAVVLGLEPPAEGCAWQLWQLVELNPGPSPVPGSPGIVPLTESVWLNRASPFRKY